METNKSGALIAGGFGAGVGAALAMIVVMGLLRFISNTISIPELMEDSLVKLSGGQINSFFINWLGVGGKALLLVSIVEGTLLVGGLLGLAFTRFWPANLIRPGGKVGSGLLLGLVVGLLLNIVFLPLVGQGFFGSSSVPVTAPPDIARALYNSSIAPWGVPVPLSMFILSLVFGLALTHLLPWPRTATLETPVTAMASTAPEVGRRDFVRYGAGAVAALAAGGVLWAGLSKALAAPVGAVVEVIDGVPPLTPSGNTPVASGTTGPAPDGFANVKPALVPEFTPTENFYITTKNYVDPTVDSNSWKLTFKGLADAPFEITYEELLAMPSTERLETLACISNGVGGDLIGNARWIGVDFGELVRRAKPRSNVYDVVVRGADGYEDSFPIDHALNNECFLAYQMNGEPLTTKHGFPARLLVPGIYGMKNCKWITEVEFVDNDFKGYWESQGWSDTAPYQTMSRIDSPGNDIQAGPVYIGGVAYAGDRGIQKVEVSTDNGETWGDATLRPAAGKYTWTQWTFPWVATAGAYQLAVRATDGTGTVQDSTERSTYPDGATGYHKKPVRVS